MKKIEKWLYVHEHRDAHSQWTKRYYGIFTPWDQDKPKTFALGDNLALARSKLARLRALNAAHVEVILDEEKAKREAIAAREAAEQERVKGITFAAFGEKYFQSLKALRSAEPAEIAIPLAHSNTRLKSQKTSDAERIVFDQVLVPFFGAMPIPHITKAVIQKFAADRVMVPVTCGRKKSDKSPRDIGPEMKLLRYLLMRCVDNDIISAMPYRFKIAQHSHRTGSIDAHEYLAMRKNLSRDNERYQIMLWESGWRKNEPRKLRWTNVDFKAGLLRLDADDVKERYPRVTPISYELRRVLLEIKEEQQRVPNLGGFVFTRKNGKPISAFGRAFKVAAKAAGIPDAMPHDLRRSCIRRWESLGIPRGAVMQASGHRPTTVHEKYAELSERELVAAFRPVMMPVEPKGAEQIAAA